MDKHVKHCPRADVAVSTMTPTSPRTLKRPLMNNPPSRCSPNGKRMKDNGRLGGQSGFQRFNLVINTFVITGKEKWVMEAEGPPPPNTLLNEARLAH